MMKNLLKELIGLSLLAMVLQGCVSSSSPGIPKGAEPYTKADTESNQSPTPTSDYGIKNATFQSSSNIEIDFSYSYRPKNGGPSRSLQNGEKLHSGDSYKIQFTPKEAGYVYIFQSDSGGQLFRLFPTTDFSGADVRNNRNPVQAHRTYFVPGESRSFVLDKQVGNETIHFLVFNEQNPGLEAKSRALLQFRQQGNQEQVDVAQANISDYIDKGVEAQVRFDKDVPVKSDSEGIFDNVQGRRLECQGSNCVSSLKFRHLP
ncbi:MAG: hypothetical protein DRR19_17240 [Candidatus Parabeggiatoa sp. nov. 1]|nr:MAG: hypothetical protein DRR19_17240 [Gammaproteobacteria bacterium]